MKQARGDAWLEAMPSCTAPFGSSTTLPVQPSAGYPQAGKDLQPVAGPRNLQLTLVPWVSPGQVQHQKICESRQPRQEGGWSDAPHQAQRLQDCSRAEPAVGGQQRGTSAMSCMFVYRQSWQTIFPLNQRGCCWRNQPPRGGARAGCPTCCLSSCWAGLLYCSANTHKARGAAGDRRAAGQAAAAGWPAAAQ